MITIPLLNLTREIEELWPELIQAISGVLRAGQFILGPGVQALEQELAAFLGVQYTIGVNSGTDALLISLRAAGVGPGDQVITTPYTFYATAEVISLLGAEPVFVDIRPDTFNMDIDQIAAQITPRTKAILPVHLFGQAADMDGLLNLARQSGLKVIEDTAQAFGGEYRGRKLGSLGDAGAFSFFPSKNLGAYGDGGLIATNDPKIAEQARMLRAHGARRKYYNEVVGYNSRLDELQAAILRVKLPRVESWNSARRQTAQIYEELLSGIPDLALPVEASYARHVYHQYTVRVLKGQRDRVQKELTRVGISTMVYYPVPVHRLPVYQELGLNLPVAEQAAEEALSLPMGPYLTRKEQEAVCSALKSVLGM